MSDFCAQCSEELGAPPEWSDFNAEGQVLCEGCGVTWVDQRGRCVADCTEKHGARRHGWARVRASEAFLMEGRGARTLIHDQLAAILSQMGCDLATFEIVVDGSRRVDCVRGAPTWLWRWFGLRRFFWLKGHEEDEEIVQYVFTARAWEKVA